MKGTVPTTQTVGVKPPPEEKKTLALYLECPDCKTRRGFMLSKTLLGVDKRELSGVKFESTCAVCHRVFSVTICWVEFGHEWTTRDPKFEGFPVFDNMEMQPERRRG